jgi:hypothetical protein
MVVYNIETSKKAISELRKAAWFDLWCVILNFTRFILVWKAHYIVEEGYYPLRAVREFHAME